MPSVGTQSELSDLSCHDDHTVVVVFFFVKFIDGGINTAAGRLSTERDRFIPTTKRHTYTIDTGFRATYIPAA